MCFQWNAVHTDIYIIHFVRLFVGCMFRRFFFVFVLFFVRLFVFVVVVVVLFLFFVRGTQT